LKAIQRRKISNSHRTEHWNFDVSDYCYLFMVIL